jgi:putative transcriptional regulator
MSEPLITNTIRRLRFERGEMTQQALADAVGVTRQTIIALEAGKYTPSLLLAMKLARHFGVTVDELFHFAETEAAPPAPPSAPATPPSP